MLLALIWAKFGHFLSLQPSCASVHDRIPPVEPCHERLHARVGLPLSPDLKPYFNRRADSRGRVLTLGNASGGSSEVAAEDSGRLAP